MVILIYIIHSDKIYDFRLPNNISGKYILTDYDQYGTKRNLVNIEATNDKWFIYQNKNVRIDYKNQKYDSISLEYQNFYKLTLLEKEEILIYTMPSYDDTFKMFAIKEDGEFIVGNSATSDIKVNLGINEDLLKISYKNNQYTYEYLQTNKSLYVNKQQSDKGYLSNFDTLFLYGLKLTFINNKFLINNPTKQLTFSQEKFTTIQDTFTAQNNPTDVRTYADFYDEGDYYFKSPVFKPQITNFTMNIEDPPVREEKDKSSIVMSIVPSLIMTVSSVFTTYTTIKRYKNGEASKDDLLETLIVAAGFIFVSILWPFIERFITNIAISLKNRKRNKLYLKYLDKKEKELENINLEQKMTLTTNNLSYTSCKNVIDSRSSELFSHNIDSDEFLKITFGIGNVKINGSIEYNEPSYTEENNKIIIKIKEMINKYSTVQDVPVTMSLKEENVTAFILENKQLYKEYMQGIILQLMTLQSYYDLKFVVLTSSRNSELSYLKDSNYCFDDDHQFRYYATNLEEAQIISTTLERELNIRKSKNDETKNNIPYYLIISDSINMYRNLNIVNDIIHSDKSLNFGILMYDLKTSNIPSDCINFVNISKNEGAVFKTNSANETINKFKPTFVVDENVDVDKYSRLISNIPIKKVQNQINNSSLTNSFGFLQMYNVGNVEQLNVISKWEQSNPSSNLSTPIGIDANQNLIYLDLHERNHGPHGLIAGMTGSGKSELIITYVLSLAVNYRPDEVQFVLIDYKGGGLAGAFENRKNHIKLPHLVGTITNLDKAEMNRTLVSINSELQRRQRAFNVVKESLNIGGIDIYKYQKLHRDGVIKEPMSHLFIICDEFAELKAQQPEFMDELVSAARIGRSLGIHLILATQKPSGVVDDQIWSNAKFKICCRVQTEEDSNEMIKKPDAAFLKNAGSFYLQVGYDEYFVQGQSAYSGIPYIPTDRISIQVDNDITFIDDLGETYKTIFYDNIEVIDNKKDLGEEFINVLHYIIKESEANSYKYNQLWLDNIPARIFYNDIIKKYDIKSTICDINPVIGEYDDPKNQKQGYVSLPITTGGNTFICGMSGSGKNTLLSTLVYSTIINHNCDEVNIYIIDLGSEKLLKFQNAPQVGDVLTVSDTEKIKYLFYTLDVEKTKRQKYYADKNSDFTTDAINSRAPFPNIVVIIYDIDVFKEAYEDLYDNIVSQFTRNCSKYGINFVVTGTTPSSLGFMLENNFPQTIMLNMVDQSDHTLFFKDAPIISKNPGRGIFELNDESYEFQVPLIFEEDEEEDKLKYILTQLSKFLKNPAPRVPTIPDSIDIEKLSKYKTNLANVPIGINIQTAQVEYFDFTQKISLTSSNSLKTTTLFFKGIINFLATYSNTSIIVLNGIKGNKLALDPKVKQYEGGFKKIIPILSSNIEKYNSMQNTENKFLIFVLGYGKLNDYLSNNEESDEENNETTKETIVTENIDNIIIKSKNDNFKFILFDSETALEDNKDNDVFNDIDTSSGIWIGSGYRDQMIFDMDDMFSNADVKEGRDTAVIVKSGKSSYIKFIK